MRAMSSSSSTTRRSRRVAALFERGVDCRQRRLEFVAHAVEQRFLQLFRIAYEPRLVLGS
jgi:hypothetical protein